MPFFGVLAFWITFILELQAADRFGDCYIYASGKLPTGWTYTINVWSKPWDNTWQSISEGYWINITDGYKDFNDSLSDVIPRQYLYNSPNFINKDIKFNWKIYDASAAIYREGEFLHLAGTRDYYINLSGPTPTPTPTPSPTPPSPSTFPLKRPSLKGSGSLLRWNASSGEIYSGPAQEGVVMVAQDIALLDNGTVITWGSTPVPSGLSDIVQISASSTCEPSMALPNLLSSPPVLSAKHYLALRSNGTVIAWGSNHAGQCNIPSNLNQVVQISAGFSHSLALKADGTVVAWGGNTTWTAPSDGTWFEPARTYTNEQNVVPTGLADVVKVAAGSNFSVALKRDGTVVVWGDRHLKRGYRNGFDYPGSSSWIYFSGCNVQVPAGLNNVVDIYAGDYTIALKRDGSIVSWGRDSFVDQVNLTGSQYSFNQTYPYYPIYDPYAFRSFVSISSPLSIVQIDRSTGLRSDGSLLPLGTKSYYTPPELPKVSQTFTSSKSGQNDQLATILESRYRRTQTINSFTTISSRRVNEPLTISPPLSTSGRAVSLSVKTGPATISNNVVTFTGSGQVTLAANQPGDWVYMPANEVATTFNVLKMDQTISFNPITSFLFGRSVNLNASSTSGLPITYTSSPPGILSISGSTLTAIGQGSVTVTASQSGNNSWNAAPSVSQGTVIQPPILVNDEFAIDQVSPSMGFLEKTVALTFPEGTTNVQVTLVGASGAGADGGRGAQIDATLKISPGEVLYLTVGGTNGYNGGGLGYHWYYGRNKRWSGGGATDLRLGGLGLSNRVVVAGGGGGAGEDVDSSWQTDYSTYPRRISLGRGGDAGQDGVTSGTGAPGTNAYGFGGKAGSLTNGGQGADGFTYKWQVLGSIYRTNSASAAGSGVLGEGGAGADRANYPGTGGGGGGGGYYGGGGGGAGGVCNYTNIVTNSRGDRWPDIGWFGGGGGGGGSSYSNPQYATAVSTKIVTTRGNGYAIIRLPKKLQTLGSFMEFGSKVFGDAPFELAAPLASSGLPVSFTVKSGPASISGNKVSLTGAGTVVLAANQTGNNYYTAATEVTTTFTIAQSSQIINAFTTVANQTFSNGATVTITPPTASSGLPVVLSVLSGPATISGNTVTLTGVGTVVLRANQSGNANYTAAGEVTTSFSVVQGNQGITFGSLTNRTYGNAPFALNATASSGLPVRYSSTSTNISLSSNVVTILGAGTATITASQSGSINWTEATPVNQNLLINQAPQTINAFTTVASQTFSNGAIVTITPPTTSSSLPVTVSVKSGPATISGNAVTLTGAGTVVLAANQPGNSNYLAATEVTTSFSVGSGSQSITFPGIPSQAISTNQITLNATASSGLPISYSIVSGAATISSSNTLSITGIGTITVEARQNGSSDYQTANPVRQTFVVSRGSQSISFSPLETNTYGMPSYRLTNATASSGLPVSYASAMPSVATIVSNTLTIVGAGTTTITASQPGNSNWAAATNVARMLVVLKASNTLSGFGALTNRSYVPNGVATLPAPLPNASSRLPVSISVKSGPAVMSGTNAVRMTGGGTVVLAANQAGNANYLAAPEVTTSFQILQATQSITPFAQITPKTNGTAPFAVTIPAASSALPVTLSVLSGPATISGNTVSLLGAGQVTLAANQGGNSNYLPAPQVTNSFSVAQGNQTITFAALSNRSYGGAPFAIRGTSSSGLPLTYTSTDTNVAIVTTNSVADVVTDLGDIPMELLTQSAPVSVANFISFADKGAYDNSFFHRSVPGFVIQGGGYVASTNLAPISAKAPITNEYSISNTRGTVAMALVGTNPNSATTQWFINLTNNSSILDNTNIAGNPPFAVFARVLGKGLSVVDSIASLPIYNADAPFNELPARGVTNGQLNLKVSNLVSMDIGIVRGPVVVIVGAGTATIVASQSGNSNYVAATPVTNTLVVGRVRALVALSNLRHTYDGVAKSVIVTTTPRSLPVTVTYRNGSAAPVNAGNYPVMATVNDSNYSGVATGILAVARATQTITFAPASSVNFSTNGVINLEATSSSGLPVTYTSSIPAVLSISGSKAYMKKRGSSIITATQAGNSNIAPAVSIRKIITVK